MCAGCLIQGVGLHTGHVCVFRLPGTRSGVTYWACLCVQVAWYKGRGYILCVFMCAGCLIQGAGLHTGRVCVYGLPGTRSGVTYCVCLCVQVAWYKERGYILDVFMCAGCLVQGVGLHTGCVYVCRLPGTRSGVTYWVCLCVQVAWYKEQGCTLKSVAVPKGGMVLWDSRVIHDTCLPIRGRANTDRWRFVTFVCMTPASSASKHDLGKKRRAYDELLLTNHWPSQMMRVLPEKTPSGQKDMYIKKLPDIAKSMEARQLAGVEPYDFKDGEPNGGHAPAWLNS